MNCSNCKNNYLLDIFNNCVRKYERNNEALIEFDRICLRSGDPRSSLTILKSMYSNSCEDCKKYEEYYRK